MCGRYGFVSPREQSTTNLIAATRAETMGDGVEELLVPRFNIAPSQPVVAARTWVRDGRADLHGLAVPLEHERVDGVERRALRR